MEEEDLLPLSEYVKLPTTVDFQVINTKRFPEYAKDKPDSVPCGSYFR